MATATTRAGRNDLCPCGSGKKFKKCCEAKQAASSKGSRVLMIVVAAALLGGLAMAGLSMTTDAGRPAPGQVWSAEHGHYHAAGTVD